MAVNVLNKEKRTSELKRSLSFVTLAASFGLPFFAITGGPALTGFIRMLGANDFVFSVIMALPVLGAVIQVFVSYLMLSTGKRKTWFLIFGFIHRPIWFLIAFIPFLIDPEKSRGAIIVIMVLISISYIANSIVGLAFNSWMGDLVPVEIKGRFFSRRTMIYTITGGAAALVSGLLLDRIHGYNGYALVFVIAAILGTADIFMFFWIKDPPMAKQTEKVAFGKLFFESFRDKNYMRFTMFVALWYFSVNIAGPFFNVYMLEEMKMSYLLITLFTQVASNVVTVLFIRIWGRLSDRYGNKPVMFICSVFILSMPFLWTLANQHTIWVVLVINMMGGLFWPGYEMTAMNQSIWLAPEKNRSIYLANYALIVMVVGNAAAFLVGGAFMQLSRLAIPADGLMLFAGIRVTGYHLLFIVSGILRVLVLVFTFRRYHEEGAQSAGQLLQDVKGSLLNTVRR